ncbi:MAG TPA: hypothetical protein VJA94_23050, partial [Candidatus Angelobacter sp.]
MRRAMVILITLCVSPAYAQARKLPDAPAPKKTVIIANVAMWSASFVLADSTARGTRSCVNELSRISRLDNLYTSAGGGTRHPYKKTLVVALPLDAGVTALSMFLHRRRHLSLAVWLPGVSMGTQFGAAAVQYGSGCA